MSPVLAYKSKQSLWRAVKRVITSLPQSPNKKKAVIKKIADAVGFVEHSEMKQVDLSVTTDHVKEKVKQFYVRDDISRQAPGRKDSVVIKEDLPKEALNSVCFRGI